MIIKTPLFIVFEGIDGAGKSTQALRLYNFCNAITPTALLQEPTQSKHGQTLRKMLKGEIQGTTEELLDLFIKDREYDVEHNIQPLLQKGIVVIVDRYFYSTAAYQATDIVTPDVIVTMNINKGFPVPNRVYFIDVEPSVALKRIQNRSGNNREIFESLHILEKIRKNYLSLVNDTFAVIKGYNYDEETLFKYVLHDFTQHFITE